MYSESERCQPSVETGFRLSNQKLHIAQSYIPVHNDQSTTGMSLCHGLNSHGPLEQTSSASSEVHHTTKLQLSYGDAAIVATRFIGRTCLFFHTHILYFKALLHRLSLEQNPSSYEAVRWTPACSSATPMPALQYRHSCGSP